LPRIYRRFDEISEGVVIWTIWLIMILCFLMMLGQLGLEKIGPDDGASNSRPAEEEAG